MYDKYERNDSAVSWMIAGGARYDEPDPRHLLQLVALREANRESSRSISPIAWLRERFSALLPATAAPGSTTDCCAPA